MTERTCPCGSGLPRTAQHDGYGIFLCFACPKCRHERVSAFRPDIFERYECDEDIEPDDDLQRRRNASAFFAV
jgi:hypothetical protein